MAAIYGRKHPGPESATASARSRAAEAASLGSEDLAGATAGEHFRYFGTFVATLLADFAAYLERNDLDLAADRVGYRQVPLWLTDEEFDDMVREMGRGVQARLDNAPGPGRRRRLLTTIVMPDARARESGPA